MNYIKYLYSGTCDGYSEIRSSKYLDKKVIKLIDNRGVKPQAKGKTCYSISIQNGYYVFGKIQIIRDGKRSQSIGFVKFNLIIPVGIKLNTNIISLLDEGLGYYTDDFVDGNFILNDDNKQNSNFEEKIEELIANVQIQNVAKYNWSVGQSKPAYIFVNKSNLISYFEYDKIFQPDYSKYHEIYFIEDSDHGEDSILQALKHEENAELTNIVSLEKLSNPLYNIKFIKKDEKIKCRGLGNGQEVRINDRINLNFSKANYETDHRGEFNGYLNELLNKYPTIFRKSTSQPLTIEIYEPHFKPEVKEIELVFRTREDKIIDLKNLTVRVSQEIDKIKHDLPFTKGKFKLVGDQIKLSYTINVVSENFKTFNKSYIEGFSKQKIVLDLKKERKEFPLKTVAFFVLITGVLSLIYIIDPLDLFIKEEIKTPMPEKVKIDTSTIINYLEGDSLLLARLMKYENMKINDNIVNSKIKNSIRFRTALDGQYRDSIQYAYDSLKGLSKPQNLILKLILDTYKSNNFHDYLSIPNRSEFTVKQIVEKIEEYKETFQNQNISEKQEVPKKELVNVHKNDKETIVTVDKDPEPKPNPKSNNLYTPADFYSNLKAGSLEDTKMTPEMKKIRSLWDQTSKSKRNTIEFKSLSEFKLSLQSLNK